MNVNMVRSDLLKGINLWRSESPVLFERGADDYFNKVIFLIFVNPPALSW